MITVNINSWRTFRDLWATEAAVNAVMSSATVVCLQEHHLTSQDECSDAVEWCHKRGYNASFNAAIGLESGKPSGGVAILTRDRDDIGVTDPGAALGGHGHRLMALRVDILG